MNFEALLDLAIEAARAAGKIIQAHAHLEMDFEEKVGGSSRASQVLTEVDKAAERAIIEILSPSMERYDLALLAEETADDGSRFEKDFFWCIDPMDGTLAFLEKRPDYAVSIALVTKDGQAKIGVVYDPSRDNLYQALQGQGAYKNGQPWSLAKANSYLSYVSDHSLEKSVGAEKIQSIITTKQKELGLSETRILSGGGLVINAMRCAENKPAFMLKIPKPSPGCGSIWDYAATVCICLELGMRVEAFSGGPLELNHRGGSFMNEGGMVFENF